MIITKNSIKGLRRIDKKETQKLNFLETSRFLMKLNGQRHQSKHICTTEINV